ncbi:S9 family peptidase [Pseudoalteromonas byunsanensis]|uniref:Peptidase S9 family protein n=1 Tax=Pseudoalteromonas byunsanensis TaxID=327939 RepID=A0A1S1NE37_9GAMM|nr:S9 family peptidase [Pseudoalteromonas byunsanensis]OHU96623.1 peptidase S9 family protein [Pseudoalteromonas byunsanensis]
MSFRLKKTLQCTFFAFSVLPVCAQANLGLQAEDIFELEYASDPQISPNGEQIIYVRNSNDVIKDAKRQNLWLVDSKSNTQSPLFSDENRYNQPRWSPDGNKLAFVSNVSGSNQIHVHYLKQNRSALLTQLKSEVSDLTWSPDGKWLAFSQKVEEKPTVIAKMPTPPKGASWSEPAIVIDRAYYQADGRGLVKPGYRQIFILPSEGGTPRQLTSGNYHHGGKLAWRTDSKSIIFSANRISDWEYKGLEGDLFEVNFDGQITQLTSAPGKEHSPSFSQNGKQLAYLSASGELNPYRNHKLNIMDWQTKKSLLIAEDFDRSIENPTWVSTSKLAISYDDHGMKKLATITTNGKISDLTDSLSGTTLGRPYLSGQFSANYKGEIAFTKGSSQRPADVALTTTKGKVKQLTKLNEDLLAHKELGKVHEITYASSFDEEQIQGWYITPPNFDPTKKYPLLLEIHGGPHLAYGPHFSAELQRYAAQGYVVFYDNHRGSSSYGKRFAMLLKYKYSSKEDFADHNSGVDAMLDKGFIDKNNLFIAGGSAGGIATAYAIGLTNRFNAAVVVKPVINWLSKVLTADSGLLQIPTQFPGMPWEHMEHYWQRSPLSLVGNVTTPTMLMTGEEDLRTPMAETEQFYQALKHRKVDSVLVKIPGAPHGIAGRPSRMISKIEHTLAWFEKYKK